MPTTTIKINGETIDLTEDFDLVIDNVSEGMERIAAHIAWAGTLWAEAEMEVETVDREYRSWRAEMGKVLLDENPKLAEWKIKQIIESDENFGKCKHALAIAHRNALILRSHFDALKAKASALQSRGAMLRAELESTGMTTRSRAPAVDHDERPDKERTRGLVGKKKKKG